MPIAAEVDTPAAEEDKLIAGEDTRATAEEGIQVNAPSDQVPCHIQEECPTEDSCQASAARILVVASSLVAVGTQADHKLAEEPFQVADTLAIAAIGTSAVGVASTSAVMAASCLDSWGTPMAAGGWVAGIPVRVGSPLVSSSFYPLQGHTWTS